MQFTGPFQKKLTQFKKKKKITYFQDHCYQN